MKQHDRIDFQETFALIIKPETIRLILSIAMTNNWKLRQLDVANVFLHGILKEIVNMRQPSKFHDKTHPDFVCRLLQSIYGLKQSPGAWFHRLHDFFIDIRIQGRYHKSVSVCLHRRKR